MSSTTLEPHAPSPSFTTSSIDLTAILLILQAGIGLVSWIGTIVLSVFMGNPILFAAPIAIGTIGVGLPLILARGILRLRRKARTAVIVYETVIVLAFIARLFIGREYAIGLVPLLTSTVVPLTVLTIVLNRSCRQAFAKQKRVRKAKKQKSAPVLEPVAAAH